MRTIIEPTMDDLLYVSSRICAGDRQELALTRDPDDYENLARDAWESSFKKVVLDGEPVMAFGAKMVSGGTALVWGYKTELGWSAVRDVTKFIKRAMIPQLRCDGVRRAVCLVHPLNVTSQKWLAHLGFSFRATQRGFGTRTDELWLFQRDEPQ